MPIPALSNWQKKAPLSRVGWKKALFLAKKTKIESSPKITVIQLC